MPALGSVDDIVDHDQRLHQTANDERVYGDDRKPRYRCKPPWIFSVTIMPEAISDEYPRSSSVDAEQIVVRTQTPNDCLNG